MKKVKFIMAILLFLSVTMACNEDNENENGDVVGTTTVALDANKTVLRMGESILGNLYADAWMSYVKEEKGVTPDCALPNGGNIRFTEETRPDGIYPAGDITMDDIFEMCYYDNNLMMIEVTGAELKSTLERSVSVLPDDAKGWFLQCSAEISYTADLSRQAQVLDETDEDNPVILTEGDRITSVKINGEEYSLDGTYKIIVTDYAGNGNDGFVTLGGIDASKKTDLGDYREAIIYYLENYSPVTPVLEGRITIN